MKGKILIAVPTFENIKPECFKSIYNLRNPKDYLLYFDYVKGYDCARARNEIAKLAIKYGFKAFRFDCFEGWNCYEDFTFHLTPPAF